MVGGNDGEKAVPQASIGDLLTDRLRVSVSLRLPVPRGPEGEYYGRWFAVLSGAQSAVEGVELACTEPVDDDARPFLRFFLQTLRLFCELGRLPVFDVPRLASVSYPAGSPRPGEVELELELPLFPSVPESSYRIAIDAAAGLCGSMATVPPTPENVRRVFDAVAERLIEPLRKRVPGGDSTIPVLRVAHAMGIPFMHLGQGVYQLGWGRRARRLERGSTGLDSAMGAKLAQNKAASASILRTAGLPVPVHVVTRSEARALEAVDRLGFPLVVKPADRDRGEGVSVDIMDRDAARRAYIHAHRQSKTGQVLVERQAAGTCHRLFIADGQLLYAVKRLPLSVTGDGRHTVAELVARAIAVQDGRAPWNRVPIQPIDDKALAALARAGLSAQSRPAVGERAPLRRIESTADGGIDEDVSTQVHPDNVAAAVTAAAVLGLHVAGVDIISPDIARPWHENGAIINEVNYSPLLGGGEISRAAIPRFLARFIEGDGRIPVEFFETEDDARARQARYRQDGLGCHVITATTTLDADGNPLAMPVHDARLRLKALLCRPDVDAIVACVPGSLLRKGIPA